MADLTPELILSKIPQQPPFRFIDTLLHVDEDSIEGQYTFKADEGFYAGHFPGNPITPGVILLETLAQTGVVAFGLFLVAKEKGFAELDNWLTLFSDANVEFYQTVKPNETVTICAKKCFWRRMKLKVEASMYNADKQLVCSATLSGVGVRKS